MAGKILNDAQIVYAMLNGDVVVTPLLSVRQVGATIDLRLGTEFVVKRMDRLTYFDPIGFNRQEHKDPGGVARYYETIKKVEPTTPFVLHPGHFALGCTLEYIKLPPTIGGQLEGRSGWAREGLNVHSTAGLIHPGHDGVIVFELQNAGTHPLPLYPGTRVAQLWLYELTGDTKRPYGKQEEARYVHDFATSYGRPWMDWEFEALSNALDGKGEL